MAPHCFVLKNHWHILSQVNNLCCLLCINKRQIEKKEKNPETNMCFNVNFLKDNQTRVRAARMLTPGATRSGFRIAGVMGSGPR